MGMSKAGTALPITFSTTNTEASLVGSKRKRGGIVADGANRRPLERLMIQGTRRVHEVQPWGIYGYFNERGRCWCAAFSKKTCALVDRGTEMPADAAAGSDLMANLLQRHCQIANLPQWIEWSCYVRFRWTAKGFCQPRLETTLPWVPLRGTTDKNFDLCRES